MDFRQKVVQVFRPGSTVINRQFLFGREQEILDLKNILIQPGEHPIIIGERGVGKTSLAKIVLKELELEYSDRTCSTENNTYNRVFRDLLQKTGYDFNIKEEVNKTGDKANLKGGINILSGGLEESEERTIRKELNGNDLTPWDVFEMLKSFNKKIALVLDEYDAIHEMTNEKQFRSNTAYTIKTLSDHSDECDSRLVIIGVARSSDELFGKHESIERNLKEIYLRPLKKQHVFELLRTAEEVLDVRFEDTVKDEITSNSLGFPYYVHFVARESIWSMLNRDSKSRTVKYADFVNGFGNASKQAFQAELSKYKKRIEDSSPAARKLVYSLSAVSSYPSTREKLKDYFYGFYPQMKNRESFDELINDLASKKILKWSPNSNKIQFIDPLLRPFLRTYMGIDRKQVTGTMSLFD